MALKDKSKPLTFTPTLTLTHQGRAGRKVPFFEEAMELEEKQK